MRKYWLASRPYSFTAALVPTLLGTAAARLLHPNLGVHWGHFVLTLLGCVGVQVVSNLVNDLYDARWGLDNPENYGRFNAIVSGLVTEGEVRRLTLVVSVLSLAIAAYLVWVAPVLLGLVAFGAFLAFAYTAPPFKLKYRALGDVAVLLGFGLGMALGAYLVQAHAQPDVLSGENLIKLLAFGLPSALLVVAILHANNHRDRENDREYGARTLGNVLTAKGSMGLLYSLLLGAYVLSAVGAVLQVTTLWNLLPLLSLPALIPIMRDLRSDQHQATVPAIAKLHGLFGLLTTIAIVAAARPWSA